MAYPITRTDNTTIATIADGTVNSSATSLTLIGKNYAGYGNFLNENFVKLLENFAYSTAPSNPQTGQLWYDSANKILKLSTSGTANEWKPIASLTASLTAPTSPAPVIGDLWWDSASNSLNAYASSTLGWINIGPSFSTTGGTTGSIVADIQDSLGNFHSIIKLLVQGSLVGIISSNTAGFIPQTTITGFPFIYYGYNVHSSAKFDGGEANNAAKLNGFSSSSFLRSDANDDNSGYNLTVGSLTVGGYFTQTENTANVQVKNVKNNSDLNFYVTAANVLTPAFTLTGSTAKATFSNDVLVNGALTANTTVSVVGNVIMSQSLRVSGVIFPANNGTGSLGLTGTRFANVFANGINITDTVNSGNVFSTRYVGTYGNITTVNATTVAATQATASSYIKTGVYATTSARDAAITSPTAGMIVFVTTGTTFWGYNGSAWVALN
jgi:hypothetical protein